MNFALILLILVVLTGIAWVLDKLVFQPQRRRAADAAVAEFDRQQERIGERFADENAAQTRARLRDDKLRQPWWLEYTASFFPVILVVFVVRSFVVEPFKIPSGSMVPTLLVGDFILVNKYEYGLRLPIINTKLTDGKPLTRGDVVVFRYPKDESVDYIKRVIGLPGDTVAYENKKLTINGKPVPETQQPDYFDDERIGYAKQFVEDLDGRRNAILNNPASAAVRHRRGRLPVSRQLRLQRAGCDVQGAAGPLLHDGRQPRQQRRQPLLGLRAGQEHRRTRVFHLDELQQPEANRRVPVTLA